MQNGYKKHKDISSQYVHKLESLYICTINRSLKDEKDIYFLIYSIRNDSKAIQKINNVPFVKINQQRLRILLRFKPYNNNKIELHVVIQL